MAKTHILILLTWTLLQAVGICDTADTCVRPIDNAENIRSLRAAVDSLAKQHADLTSQLQDLKRDVGLKVAFSASLADSTKSKVKVGPNAAPQTLVFKRVLINNGNAYNRYTGIFTAPQKGAYQFTFTTYGVGSNTYQSGAQLEKNNLRQVTTEIGRRDHGTTSGAAILSLNTGDTVYVKTWGRSSFQVSDDKWNHLTTFSGVLLFPL